MLDIFEITTWHKMSDSQKKSLLNREELWYLDMLAFYKGMLTRNNLKKDVIDMLYESMSDMLITIKAIRYIKGRLPEFEKEYCVFVCISKAKKLV